MANYIPPTPEHVCLFQLRNISDEIITVRFTRESKPASIYDPSINTALLLLKHIKKHLKF